MSSSRSIVLRIAKLLLSSAIFFLFFLVGNLDGVHLTLTAFSKELSASKMYQDIPISLKFDVSFNNQGTYSCNHYQQVFNTLLSCMFHQSTLITRMHSSRMRTVGCSRPLGRGSANGGGSVCPRGVCQQGSQLRCGR